MRSAWMNSGQYTVGQHPVSAICIVHCAPNVNQHHYYHQWPTVEASRGQSRPVIHLHCTSFRVFVAFPFIQPNNSFSHYIILKFNIHMNLVIHILFFCTLHNVQLHMHTCCLSILTNMLHTFVYHFVRTRITQMHYVFCCCSSIYETLCSSTVAHDHMRALGHDAHSFTIECIFRLSQQVIGACAILKLCICIIYAISSHRRPPLKAEDRRRMGRGERGAG